MTVGETATLASFAMGTPILAILDVAGTKVM